MNCALRLPRCLRFQNVFLAVVTILGMLALLGCQNRRFSFAAPPAPPMLEESKYTKDKYTSDLKLYDDNVTANPTIAKNARDRIIYNLMAEIDDAYGQYTKTLYTGKGAFGVVADTELLGLTAASGIARNVGTKTILGTLATGFAGVNLSFDKNFFAQQTYQTIGIAMQNRRDKAREAINERLGDGVDDYPLAAARRDLVSYYYAGTLPGGLQELQEQIGNDVKQQGESLH